MFLVLLLGLYLTTGELLNPVSSCPSQCSCFYHNLSDGSKARSVICNDPEISLVPVGFPVDTSKLRIEKTAIQRIPSEAFNYLSSLEFLWMSFNTLSNLSPDSFQGLLNLEELRLDGNALKAFPWESLMDMSSLRLLDLHNNQLTSLPAEATTYIKNLTYLDLSSNSLLTLPSEVLSTWLEVKPVQGPESSKMILGLHDNPWVCDCQISMVTSLSMSLGSPVVLMDQLLICRRSLGQSGMLLTQAELSRCMRPSVQPAATRVISPLGSNVILRCDATGYPTPTLTWIKTSAYADCCQQDILENFDQLPKSLESFMQESPRVGVRWSIISLNGLSYKDAGEYRCQARNMAGISEAPIKLKVVGVTRLSRLPKKKSQKTPPKSSSKYRKPNQTPAPTNIPSVKENQILQNITPPSIDKTQTAPKVVYIDKYIKRRKMNLTDAKTTTSVKSTPEPPEKSRAALLSETLV